MSEFAGKVVVVANAERNMDCSHAIEFAKRGARLLINDLSGAGDGTCSGPTAQSVVDGIVTLGGEAIANTASLVSQKGAESIIDDAISNFGTVDIIVNNAGILRDKTFAKIFLDKFRAVLDVHLMGSVQVTRAAWQIMTQNGWGRMAFTSSGPGIFGNFGQSNYASAKMALVRLMNVLALEGGRKGIKVTTIEPGARTRMAVGLKDPNRRGSLR